MQDIVSQLFFLINDVLLLVLFQRERVLLLFLQAVFHDGPLRSVHRYSALGQVVYIRQYVELFSTYENYGWVFFRTLVISLLVSCTFPKTIALAAQAVCEAVLGIAVFQRTIFFLGF